MGGSVALARYVVDAVVLEGRGVREVARTHGVSKSWVSVLVGRYRAGGYQALEPRSRRTLTRPNRTPDDVEDVIVRLRKELSEAGFDAGARTIQWHLKKEREAAPSISTIWRVLARRGFVEPQPEKRPHASITRFEAALPNECWQADVTHWQLQRGREVEILTFLDDHSRLIVASRVTGVTKVHDVVATFHEAGGRWGYPASVLTDNAAIFTAAARRGTNVFETELKQKGIVYRHSRPYHPADSSSVRKKLSELL
jgi:transposase InsO family protein